MPEKSLTTLDISELSLYSSYVKVFHLTRGGIPMLEKTTRMNYLYDFYQSLLTPKQSSYMSLYYLDDFSLGEIAEEYDISRQAVYDNIKRTEAMLEEYEEKLLLLKKFQERKVILDQLKEGFEKQQFSKKDCLELIEALEILD
jgi:uncharacterized protein